MYSYYSPGGQTENISYGPNGSPSSFYGENISAVIACDLGRRLFAVSDGKMLWQKDMPSSWPRGLCVFEGICFYADGQYIVAINPKTGFEFIRLDVGIIINAIDIREEGGVTYVTLCLSSAGVDSVRIYTLSNLNLTLFYSNPIPASNPRGAYFLGLWLFVADTFGHEVYAVDTRSGIKTISTEVYYPNSIEPVAIDEVRICAEHENRVINWRYTDNRRILEFSAPIALFNDVTNTKQDIVNLESTTAASSPPTPPKSQCAKEYNSEQTIYSPNSAKKYGDDLLIADTDNHRVIVIRDGQVVTEISGFNNPVTAVKF